MNGTVLDADSTPLAGASIVVKGTTKGTSSDFDGNFTINVNVGDVLEIGYLGFTTQEIRVADQTNLKIVLLEDASQLDEIVVVGYGTQRKSSLTASVATVNADELRKTMTPDPAISLQGRAPGVEVLTQGGIAGAEANVIIRGTGTFGNTSPLFIVDGAFTTAGLRALNPEDIETIEVLKDGSAAAIYGSRAANGVVIVTTKKGTMGAPKVTISSSTGIQTPSRKLDYLNADQWRAFGRQLAINSGVEPAPEDVSPNWSRGVDTDWQDLWIVNAPIYRVNATISGGSESATYNASIGYLDQMGVLKFSKFQKYNLRFNFGFKKGKWEVTENLGVSYYDNTPNNSFSIGGSSGAVGYSPPTVPNRDSQGDFVTGYGEDFLVEGSRDLSNDYAAAYYADDNLGNVDITGSVGASYEIIPGLKYKIALSGSYNHLNRFSHNVPYTVEVLGQPDLFSGRLNPSISETSATQFDYTIDNLFTFQRTLGNHNIDALLGFSRFSENYKATGIMAQFDDALEEQLLVRNADGTISGEKYNSVLNSVFGRLNYGFDDRYLLSLSIRRDKSSKFGPDHRVETYPSVSAGWNLHNEDFFKSNTISRFKLRGGYGELGVSSIRPYQYISIAYGPVPAIFGNSQNSPGNRSFGRVSMLADPNLKWEKSKSTNFGLDLGFFNDALTITSEYFVRKNSDILAEVPLPPSVGQTLVINEGIRPVVNIAEVENKGWEFLVDYRNYKNPFKYSLSFNLSTIKNQVTSLGDNVQPIVGNLISGAFNDRPTITDTGMPVGSFYGYKIAGIDPSTGQFAYQDTNGDNEVNDSDKVILGDPFPDFTYGFNATLEYKNIDLSLFLQGQQGGEIFSQIKYINYFQYTNNVVSDMMNAWTPTNTDTDIPIAILDNRVGGSALPNDFYVEKASYLRLKNIQLGYNFPDRLLNGYGMDGLRLYLGVQNLFTITDYSGYDPEVSSDALFNRGVDYRGFPNARTYTVGLNLSF